MSEYTDAMNYANAVNEHGLGKSPVAGIPSAPQYIGPSRQMQITRVANGFMFTASGSRYDALLVPEAMVASTPADLVHLVQQWAVAVSMPAPSQMKASVKS